MGWLFFCYTIQLITIKLCTKFQNPQMVAEKSLTEKKCLYYIRKKRRKNENLQKKAK